MRIRGAIDMGSYKEHIENENKKRILEEQLEQKRCQDLKYSMEDIICNNYSGEELEKIQLYKEAIFSYLKDNCRFDVTKDISKLTLYIKTYYKVLLKENSLSDCILLQKLSRTSENKITDLIKQNYESAKEILVFNATEKYNKQGISDALENDEINKIIDDLIKNYTNRFKNSGGLENFQPFELELLKAIEIITFIEMNTNLELNPYIVSKKLQLKFKK